MPLWLLHGLGTVIGWMVFLGSATYRKRFLANSAQAGYCFSQVVAAVAHAGRMTAELPRLWFGAAVPVVLANSELIERVIGTARGIVFLTPHLGCFEVTVQAVAHQYADRIGPITVLYRPARQRALTAVIEVARQRPGVCLAATNLAGVRSMVRALRRHQAVGLLPDQVPPMGMGQWLPFFGQDAYTMNLAPRLALQTDAAIILTWGERLSWGRGYVVHLSQLAQPLSGDLNTAMLQINQAMEGLIRQAPEQYLWAYARYKQPRQELSA